ncbi:uncharacterized protein (DUF58 family) [Thermosporothrix hazakensis]|jgi:uncharacterized protein (DUF58 family)|uniref:Uncharacterized protein (DUF58 family) n=2 Tax=Thermosporothrix TaxID=768650 RepID=A0A326U1B7_THEHA|nr:DUF58 domain-containing protein [Thermosporothrix hazakensis]PZW24682.1 uncharacterized protein (DUF58 family) [Thermosporothrix hazakensis]BBH90336.1 hypothetical protein KTC_50870 [Thermosporothrix sp. COM3]GCE48372.1 hypothetical protein KTH_32410 [Thermosporothrix hazakensis]
MMGSKSQGPRGLGQGKSITDAIWYLVSIALIILGILIHQPLLVVVGILLLLVIGTTDIWSRYCLTDLSYHRSFDQQRVLFGEEVKMSVTVENAKILPLPWLEVTDTVPRSLPIEEQEVRSAPLSNVGRLESLFSPGWYERITRQYTLKCLQRGVHTFGPTQLRSGDAFGFLSQEQELNNQQHVLVYPLVVPVTRFGLPARHPFGDRRAPRRLLEDPSRIIGVREYRYGDSMRRVHWKATARSLQLQSKIYDATTTYTLAIFLNIDTRPDAYYAIHPELQELSICAAASVAAWGLDNGYAVGLYANTMMFLPDEQESAQHTANLEARLAQELKKRRIRLPPSSSEDQRKRVMEVLARIQGFFGSEIEEVLQAEQAQMASGTSVVLITSTLNDRVVDQLARMRRRGHAVTILFAGDAPPPTGIAGASIYHIGGEQTWKELLDHYSKPEAERAQEQEVTFQF